MKTVGTGSDMADICALFYPRQCEHCTVMSVLSTLWSEHKSDSRVLLYQYKNMIIVFNLSIISGYSYFAKHLSLIMLFISQNYIVLSSISLILKNGSMSNVYGHWAEMPLFL